MQETVIKLEFFLVIFDTLFFPVLKPLHTVFPVAEEFHFHLGELPGTESKVTGIDLVTESLTDLGNTERKFLTGGNADKIIVNKNRLACFGTHICNMFII